MCLNRKIKYDGLPWFLIAVYVTIQMYSEKLNTDRYTQSYKLG